jgi:hypothetical protein
LALAHHSWRRQFFFAFCKHYFRIGYLYNGFKYLAELVVVCFNFEGLAVGVNEKQLPHAP